jgi:hypothetical protein
MIKCILEFQRMTGSSRITCAIDTKLRRWTSWINVTVHNLRCQDLLLKSSQQNISYRHVLISNSRARNSHPVFKFSRLYDISSFILHDITERLYCTRE